MTITRTQFLVILTLVLVVSYTSAAFFVYQADTKDAIDIKRVACVGDSITFGSYYPYDLQNKLGTKYDVEDFGVSGAAISLDSDKPYLKDPSMQYLRDFQPNLVIIMLGTNDANSHSSFSSSRFMADYSKLIVEFRSFSKNPSILLVLPPPVFDNGLNLNNTILVQGVIPSIREIANAFDLSTVDTYTPLVGHSNYFFDGVHPRHAGAKIIANQIYEAMFASS